MDNFAAAWLWFAPALDMDLSPQQWAEVAMSGVLFEQQTDWLRRKATEEAKVLLARLCTSDEGLIWREALRAAPDPLPEELVNAVAARLRTFDAEYDVTEIAERFAEGRHVNALRTLAGVSDQFAALVTPYLARIGERDAIGQLLDELAADLEAGNRPDGEELEWLAGIAEDRSFLPKLFQCLVRAHRARETSTPVRPRRGRSAFVGWGSLSDPVTPLVHAIRQIGGEEAVARYDAVLASEPGSEFLRLQRNAIAEAELAERGLAAGAAVVRGAALPYSPSDGRRGGAASTGGPAGAAPDGP
jgi:hypothetical protein